MDNNIFRDISFPEDSLSNLRSESFTTHGQYLPSYFIVTQK